MNIRKAIVACTFAALGSLPAADAGAQTFFFGGSLGHSDIDEGVASGLITSGSIDGKDTGFKLYGGGFFSRHFGAELSYVDLGEATYSGSFFGTPVTDGTVGVWGYNVAALVHFPLNERLALFGKLGVFLWESEASDVTDGAPFSSTTRGWDGGSFGLGARFAFARNLEARVEWEQFPVGPTDATLLSIGLQYNF